MVGGKWTTFRSFAEQTTDEVLAELGRERIRNTLDLPIGGGAGFPKQRDQLEADLVARHGIEVKRAAYLVDLYGTRAEEVLCFCKGRGDDKPLGTESQLTGAEVVFLARCEHVMCLADILLRRTPVAIRGDITIALIRRIARTLAAEFGWDDKKTLREIETFTTELATYHGVSAEMLEKRTQDRSAICA
jgi:glycerol-3-phosphate dehydrogenase